MKDFLLSSNITAATRKALQKTCDDANHIPVFFDKSFFRLLSRICDLLVNQSSENRMVNVAVFIDKRLSDKKGKGWRYNELPPDEILFITALKGIDETSHINSGKNFLMLNDEEQKQVLESVQNGNAAGNIWKQINPVLFFEVFLAEVAEIFYSYPEVQYEIQYNGMQDKNGWKMDT